MDYKLKYIKYKYKYQNLKKGGGILLPIPSALQIPSADTIRTTMENTMGNAITIPFTDTIRNMGDKMGNFMRNTTFRKTSEPNTTSSPATVRLMTMESYTEKYQKLTETYEQLVEKNNKLTEEHEQLMEDYEQLMEDYEQLSKAHEQLSKKHEQLSKDHDLINTNPYIYIIGNTKPLSLSTKKYTLDNVMKDEISQHSIIHINEDIFKTLEYYMNPKLYKQKIYVIVPGNAGLPGGGHGTHLSHTLNKFWALCNKDEKPRDEDHKKLVITVINYLYEKSQVKNLFNDGGIDIIISNIKREELLQDLNIEDLDVKLKVLLKCLSNHKLFDIKNDKKTPLEEQIMRKWLLDIYSKSEEKANIIFCETIGFKWGLMYDSPCIGKSRYDIIDEKCKYNIQDIEYTKPDYDPSKYNLSYLIENVKLNVNLSDINLLFTFAPNYATKHRDNTPFISGILTEQKFKDENNNNNDKINFNKIAIRNCIDACLDKCEKESIVLIPKLGYGVNKCYITHDVTKSDFMFMKIIEEIINFKYSKKNLRIIYVTLPPKDKSPN